jgi:hypothetical protein
MVNYLFQQQCSMLWLDHENPSACEGVILRRSKGTYITCPPDLVNSPLASACFDLNLQVSFVTLMFTNTDTTQVAMTVNSRVVRSFVASCPDAVDVPLRDDLRVQILPSVADLPEARKNQFAAFLAAEGLLVVWDDDPANLIKRAKAIESELMELIWRSNQEDDEADDMNEKGPVRTRATGLDPESGDPIPEDRPTNLLNTILVAFTLAIVITLLGLAARSLAVEISVDHDYVRLAFLALVPVQIFFTLVSRLDVRGTRR